MESVRPSRTIFGILLILFLGYAFYQGIIDKNGKPLIGKTKTTDRVSYNMIEKNVNRSRNVSNKLFSGIKVPYKPGTKNLEDGTANIITSIVVNYRGFDTLGEVMVLFTSLTGFLMLFPSLKRKEKLTKPSFIVKNGLVPLYLITLLVGIYIVFHGHLTPGGGFAGGAVIATGLLLLLIAQFKINEKLLSVLETVAGLSFLTIGLLGLFIKGSFLQNFLNPGPLGNLFSSGIVIYINLVIGLKVASELGSLVNRFTEEE